MALIVSLLLIGANHFLSKYNDECILSLEKEVSVLRADNLLLEAQVAHEVAGVRRCYEFHSALLTQLENARDSIREKYAMDRSMRYVKPPKAIEGLTSLPATPSDKWTYIPSDSIYYGISSRSLNDTVQTYEYDPSVDAIYFNGPTIIRDTVYLPAPVIIPQPIDNIPHYDPNDKEMNSFVVGGQAVVIPGSYSAGLYADVFSRSFSYGIGMQFGLDGTTGRGLTFRFGKRFQL